MSVSVKKNPTRVTICCRKRDPFQGPKLGSCLTLRNELSKETYVLTKQEILLGKGPRVESSRVRKPRRAALPRGSQCTGGVSFKPFPNSSDWWRLISSVFFIRISCHKTTHANGYYGAWPGWGGFNQCASLPEASVRNPARDKVMRQEADIRKACSDFRDPSGNS